MGVCHECRDHRFQFQRGHTGIIALHRRPPRPLLPDGGGVSYIKFIAAWVGWLFFCLLIFSWAQGGLHVHFAINGYQVWP
jgi:hypothetical protein